jgi:hypothetical protein
VNQIKPYLFWIVSGVALVVILIGAVLFAPTGEIGGKSMNASEVKSQLDSKIAKFKDLHKRAQKGDPQGIWDPVLDDDIRQLTNDYLLTPRWAEQINPNVDDYSKQLGAIRTNLVTRSKVLHEDITKSSDRLAWYTAYQEQSGAFVTQLRDAGCLVLPATPRSGRAAAPRFGVPAAGGGATTGGDSDPLNPSTGAKIREIVGLFTSSGDLPPATDHPLLTTRFRIVQAIGRVVMASGVETRPNPVVKNEKPSIRPAAIVKLEWSRGEDPLVGVTASYATYIRLTMTMSGTESALLAALAGLESLEKPVAIVVSSTLSRQERLAAGARKVMDDQGEPYSAVADMAVDVVILDYTEMPDPTSAELGTLAQPSASGGIPGMPPGGGMGEGGYPFGPGGPGGGMPGMPPGGGGMPPDFGPPGGMNPEEMGQ